MNYEDKLEKRAERWMDKFSNNPIKTIFAGFILLSLIGIGISFISGVFSTVGTVASAPGRVIQRTLTTDNIIQSYEWFYDVNAAYDARMGQVMQFNELLKTEEDKDEKRRLRIELAAMQQTCRDLATKYNANSEKMNKSIFKGWELPEVLNMEECS